MKINILKVHPSDNVLVALQNLSRGESVEYNGEEIILKENVAAKHKFFEYDMDVGSNILMYGVLVGKAQHAVWRGELTTTENVKQATEPYGYRAANYTWQAPDVTKFKNKTFNGYQRKDGRVGTANYWLFIPTVFCENRNLDVIRESLHNELGYAVTDKYKQKTKYLLELYKSGIDISSFNLEIAESTVATNRVFKNVDGIKFLNHQGGCGGTRQDAGILSKLLAAYADHQNVGGVTVMSLGCQNLQVQDFLNDLKLLNPQFDKPL